jgi:hypothetical protein
MKHVSYVRHILSVSLAALETIKQNGCYEYIF